MVGSFSKPYPGQRQFIDLVGQVGGVCRYRTYLALRQQIYSLSRILNGLIPHGGEGGNRNLSPCVQGTGLAH